jgi:hypothetical protein
MMVAVVNGGYSVSPTRDVPVVLVRLALNLEC